MHEKNDNPLTQMHRFKQKCKLENGPADTEDINFVEWEPTRGHKFFFEDALTVQFDLELFESDYEFFNMRGFQALPTLVFFDSATSDQFPP